MARVAYVHQIQELRDDVVAMASMVDKAIVRAVDALKRQDIPLGRDVMAKDREINALRWQVEEKALLVIATQAPMAGDLRTIAAVVQIVTDLERMADHAAGIAKIVVETADEPLLKPLVDIPRMSELARAMLADSITAFIDGDEPAARAIVVRDDEVDELYNQIYRELLTYMMADPGTINRATHLLWAAHNLERIADRVSNICERVVFAVTGTLEEMDVAAY
ncbi:MAG: Phosphate transport system regulatory protein PhoU [uncultured Thermomicrobiales bacterium]|uniref:Phosphate-specific transport system accessory protein PhoU n=1 Tax=uncultured Thermomicrobiales bacterium TaxID=1645740 RepID=A0A6J4TVG9_9BACT|nr:MAG: Phosphate transport system regulatory protein PhoU [uncultured Thermomicrobiales bacterium]